MSVRIGLMGFGRIGRNLFRIAYARDDVSFGGISDIADPKALEYLLRFDSIYGRFPEAVRLEGDHLSVRAQRIPMLAGSAPGDVPWGMLGVDVVVEATGRSRSTAELERHLEAGAKRVVACVPPQDTHDLTIVRGVNDHLITAESTVVSAGSCTSNAATPVLKVLHEAFGINKAFLCSTHAYTNAQRVADVPHDDMRSSRAAAENIIPTETNAGRSIVAAFPALEGRISAYALNVPVPDGCLLDMTLDLEAKPNADDINDVMRRATVSKLRGIIAYEDDPIVSKDVVGLPTSGVFDSLATMAMPSGLVKVLVWFDSGWGYAHRVLELAQRLNAETMKEAS